VRDHVGSRIYNEIYNVKRFELQMFCAAMLPGSIKWNNRKRSRREGFVMHVHMHGVIGGALIVAGLETGPGRSGR
jgi:hypothetical protein